MHFESFLERIQSLRPAFFHFLILRFTQAILPVCPRSFTSFLSLSEKDFHGLFVLDGSKLNNVGRLFKIAWGTTNPAWFHGSRL